MAVRRLVPLPNYGRTPLHPVLHPAFHAAAARLRHIALNPPPPAYVRPTFHGYPALNEVGDDEGIGGALGHPGVNRPPMPPGSSGGPPAGGGGGYAGQPVPGRGSGYLTWNPQLINPDSALGGYSDSQWMADKNAATTALMTSYHKTLQDLGYMDDAGHFVEGNLMLQDRRQRALDALGMRDADTLVTDEARERGTLWSGVRAQRLGEEQRQYVQDLSDLDINTPRDISQGYTDIGGYFEDYNTAIGRAIQAALERQAARLAP